MPASSAPITERTPHVTTIASQTMPTSALNERGRGTAHDGGVQRAAEAGDEGADPEQHELGPHDADAVGRRGRSRSTGSPRTRGRRSRVSGSRSASATKANTTATMAYISTRSVMLQAERSRRCVSPAPKLSYSWRVARRAARSSEREPEREQREVEVTDAEARAARRGDRTGPRTTRPRGSPATPATRLRRRAGRRRTRRCRRG